MNWEETAFRAAPFVFGGLLWALRTNIVNVVTSRIEKFKTEMLEIRKSDKKQIFSDINKFGESVIALDKKIDLQSQKDAEHGKQIDRLLHEQSEIHKRIDSQYSELSQKMDELKDLIIGSIKSSGCREGK